MQYTTTRASVLADLRNRGIQVAPDAFGPIRQLDFKKLVAIHDHEEHFLRTVFVSSLLSIYKARTATAGGSQKVTKHDVETALRMLGPAVANAAELTFSAPSKQLIMDICPFC
jgi:hypothetical protein